jgi:hypothetical protein
VTRPPLRVAAFITGLAALYLVGPASAATYRPTRHDDPTPGKCKPRDCSLREAVVAADKMQDADKIVLGRGKYRLRIPDDGDDDGKSGDLDLGQDVTVVGKGPRRTTVDGRGIDTVFQLLGFNEYAVKGMTIKNGNDARGGGIFAAPVTAVIKNVVLKSNTATSEGGGIWSNSPDLVLSRVSVVKNDAPTGGGMFMHAGASSKPTATIQSSTFSGNEAAEGAGLAVDGSNPDPFTEDPAASIVNSTFANNKASGNGGGVWAIEGGTLTVDNATIANNEANADDSGGGDGGGLYQASGAFGDVRDSIVADNSVGTGGAGPQCTGAYISADNILSGSLAGCTLNGDQVLDAFLGDLAANGGPTRTIAPLQISAAIDYGGTDCPARDQRGEKRPTNPAKCDAGSFERRPSDP